MPKAMDSKANETAVRDEMSQTKGGNGLVVNFCLCWLLVYAFASSLLGWIEAVWIGLIAPIAPIYFVATSILNSRGSKTSYSAV